MRVHYDPQTDSLYIHLREKPSAESEEVADGVVLDFSEDGSLLGIDIQHASEHTDVARLIFEQGPADAA